MCIGQAIISGPHALTYERTSEKNIISHIFIIGYLEKDEILSRWSEYICELYNYDNRGDMPDIAAEVESSITQREVEHALRGMPMKKSPGPGGITTEVLVVT